MPIFLVSKDPRKRPTPRHGPPRRTKRRTPWVSDQYPIGKHARRIQERQREREQRLNEDMLPDAAIWKREQSPVPWAGRRKVHA